MQFPHLHLGRGAQVGYENLRRSHLPTNRVQLQDVLYLAITELGVWPLRADWERVLAETRTA